MLVKRIVRGGVFGALIGLPAAAALFYFSIGNVILSEQQFQEVYPDADWLEHYILPTLARITGQCILYGFGIGAVVALVRWAFSSERHT